MKPEDIEKIVTQFELRYNAHSVAKGKTVGCQMCKRPDRQEVHRTMLQGLLKDAGVANKFGVPHSVLVHHKFTCLPKYGGASFGSTDRYARQRQKLFPVQGTEVSQKFWILTELLFIRDEALLKIPVDRREILKLTKDISSAAEEYREAKERAKKAKKESKPKDSELDEEFSAEQRAEMNRVGKPGGANGAGTAAS